MDTARVNYHCNNCGSDNIAVDATLYWDYNKQHFSADVIDLDRVYCEACGAIGSNIIVRLESIVKTG